MSINFSSYLRSGSGLVPTAIKTSAYTAKSVDLVRCDTTAGAFSVTLPLNPADGTIVGFLDVSNTFANNNLTVLPNGNKIENDSNYALLNINGTYLVMIYNAATTNWKFEITPTILPVTTTTTRGKIFFMKG